MSDTTTTLGRIGDLELTLDAIDDLEAHIEPDVAGEWLRARISLSYSGTHTATGDVSLSITCWDDTDDDDAEWCAANEGARIIEACITGQDPDTDTRGDFLRGAMPDACEQIGVAVCEAVRAARRNDMDDD